jgi:regulator of sigma E protease
MPVIAPVLAFDVLSTLHSAMMIAVLVLGFGFVIFWHELGHFVAAKSVGIKVEQFAVGFGQALLAWRKGVGVRIGNTQKDYQTRIDAYLKEKYPDDSQIAEHSGSRYTEAVIEAEKALGLGETEYRLNWMPLGGYVKMLGQDDLRPAGEQDDPRSYTRKSIGARMIVVSAGVIMNVILAGIGFTILFKVGFTVPEPWVGAVASDSPAVETVKIVNGQRVPAPIRVGDTILGFDGRPQQDFTKIGLNVALSAANTDLPIKVRHPDGTVDDLMIKPRADVANGGMMTIGIRPAQTLESFDVKDIDQDLRNGALPYEPSEFNAVQPGETITQINGVDVGDPKENFWKLNAALQASTGAPVKLTLTNLATKQTRQTEILAHFAQAFNGAETRLAGLSMRPIIAGIEPGSAARDKLKPGDVVVSVMQGTDTRSAKNTLDTETLRDILKKAGEDGKPITMTVLRGTQLVTIPDLSANVKIQTNSGGTARGLGVSLAYDELHPVIAGVPADSAAGAAGFPSGATIVAIDKQPVSNWFQVQRAMAGATPGKPLVFHLLGEVGEQDRSLTLGEEQIAQVAHLQKGNDYLALRDATFPRKADGIGQAISWGVGETRDFILQFYLTLRRIADGSVSGNNLMGPIGIFTSGAKIAQRGGDWLLWFLCMISANLAVVNFLPIPIVDGGLFTLLIIEKVQGKPLSPNMQAAAQYVGLAFLAGVFLFVTYHDILRLI